MAWNTQSGCGGSDAKETDLHDASGGGAGGTGTGPGSSDSATADEHQCLGVMDRPALTLEGEACGMAVSYASPPGTRAYFGRRSLTDPFELANVITIQDAESSVNPVFPDYISEGDLAMFISLDEGLAIQTGEYPGVITGGVVQACSLGMMLLAPEGATVTISEVTDTEIDFAVDLQVGGFGDTYGADAVPLCGGTVSLRYRGGYVHDPG